MILADKVGLQAGPTEPEAEEQAGRNDPNLHSTKLVVAEKVILPWDEQGFLKNSTPTTKTEIPEYDPDKHGEILGVVGDSDYKSARVVGTGHPFLHPSQPTIEADLHERSPKLFNEKRNILDFSRFEGGSVADMAIHFRGIFIGYGAEKERHLLGPITDAAEGFVIAGYNQKEGLYVGGIAEAAAAAEFDIASASYGLGLEGSLSYNQGLEASGLATSTVMLGPVGVGLAWDPKKYGLVPPIFNKGEADISPYFVVEFGETKQGLTTTRKFGLVGLDIHYRSAGE